MFGEKVKEIRKRLKLSQQSLADQMEITRQYISRIELNLTMPSLVTLMKIQELFNINAEYLFTNNPTAPMIYVEPHRIVETPPDSKDIVVEYEKLKLKYNILLDLYGDKR